MRVLNVLIIRLNLEKMDPDGLLLTKSGLDGKWKGNLFGYVEVFLVAFKVGESLSILLSNGEN